MSRYERTLDCRANVAEGDDCCGSVTVECVRERATRSEPASETWNIVGSTCAHHYKVGDWVDADLMKRFWADLAEEADAGDPMAP